MYAVIETGGKQYRVSVGDVIFVEKLGAEADSTVAFDKVVALTKDDGSFVAGTPLVKGASVSVKPSNVLPSASRRTPSPPVALPIVPPVVIKVYFIAFRWRTGSGLRGRTRSRRYR